MIQMTSIFFKMSRCCLLISKVWIKRRKEGRGETRVWGPGSQIEFKVTSATFPSFMTGDKLPKFSIRNTGIRTTAPSQGC